MPTTTDPAAFDDVIAAASAMLPAAVMAKARLLWLDSLGCIAAGLRHDEVRAMGARLAAWFPGTTRLPGSQIELGPAGAAALAAAAMCWDEANEGLAVAHGRPGLAVVPVVLALAGARASSDQMRALVLGYEVGARAGQVWRIRPGMHVDGTSHALGAAATAAALTGADPARAVRIAACQIPFSLYAPLAAGMTGRNSYASHAVLLGVLAACAAGAGSDAPAGGLAEARSLALLRDDAPDRAEAGRWLILDAYLKPYAGVRHAHYAAAAAIEAGRALGGTDTITAITLETYAEALRYAANRAPATPISAQFSLSFAVAAGLCLGDLGPDAYRNLDNPEIVRLEALVTLAANRAMTEAGRRAARLTVTAATGALSRCVDAVPGDPGLPMTPDAVVAKFRRLAAHLPPGDADRMVADALTP